MKPFLYLLIFRPTTKEREEGKKDKIIDGPKVLLAKDEKQALVAAGQQIPKDYDVDQVEVLMRPF